MKHDMSQFTSGAFHGNRALKQQAVNCLLAIPAENFLQRNWVSEEDEELKCKYGHLSGKQGAEAYRWLKQTYNFPEEFVRLVMHGYDYTRGSPKTFALKVLRAITPGQNLDDVVALLRQLYEHEDEVPSSRDICTALKLGAAEGHHRLQQQFPAMALNMLVAA